MLSSEQIARLPIEQRYPLRDDGAHLLLAVELDTAGDVHCAATFDPPSALLDDDDATLLAVHDALRDFRGYLVREFGEHVLLTFSDGEPIGLD